MFWYFDYDEPVYRPPSEAQSLILQITLGCSQNRCTFCGMYKTKHFTVRPVEEVVAQVAAIPTTHRPMIQRVFLADGDALVYPQEGLVKILEALDRMLPNLRRVAAYASPNSLTTKTVDDLAQLRERKLKLLYFGLESGDDRTLSEVNKGYGADEMLALCRKAHEAGMKLSVTAILGLAGRERSDEHAAATARWINALSPTYFSLLTLFHRHNDDFFRSLEPLTRGGILEEALTLVTQLNPLRTILRSNHVSNILNLAGSYPRDREKIISQAQEALHFAAQRPEWYDEVPDYREDRF